MTTEELKAHRRAICEALIEGKQCQMMVTGQWTDQNPQTAACNLFSDWKPECIRIKPEPRKVWIGWHSIGQFYAESEEGKAEFEKHWPSPVKWQLVEEPE